jgi:hypothetical protein
MVNKNINELSTTDVKKVYSGVANASGNHCRCGCRGRYFEDARNIKRILKIVKNVAFAGGKVDRDDQNVYADVTVYGRSYTLYFVS